MVKRSTKSTKTNSNTINSVLTNNRTPPKTRKQIYQENYQKNKEHKKQQRRQRYQQQKKQEELIAKQQSAKYYQAEAIKILMTFKEYTELSKEKKKLWQDFNWTFQDCQKSFSEGYADVVMIMKLAQVADNLIRDYRETAKSEEKKRSKNWNSLDYDQQQKIVRYWSYEKARIEEGYINEAERLEKRSEGYLKEIERAKFHEERGKIKCECYACAEQKKIRAEVIAERKKIIDEYEKRQKADKEQCPECKKLVKELDEEAGVCKSCKKKYGNKV